MDVIWSLGFLELTSLECGLEGMKLPVLTLLDCSTPSLGSFCFLKVKEKCSFPIGNSLNLKLAIE